MIPYCAPKDALKFCAVLEHGSMMVDLGFGRIVEVPKILAISL
jgi:hypothetical protein